MTGREGRGADMVFIAGDRELMDNLKKNEGLP